MSTEWSSNLTVRNQFIEERHHDEWDELVSRIDIRYHRRALHKIQDVFQKWIKPWMKPAWIVDIHISRDKTAWTTLNWKIETVEDDPDEY